MNVVCTGCPAKYSVPDEKVRGKKVRITCKHCGTNIVVDGTALEVTARASAEPAAEAPSAMTSLAASPAAAAPKPAAASAAVKPAEVKPAALESSWLVGFVDERQEQHTTSAVVDLYANHKIDDDTLVWKDGMADWLSPFDVPEIAAAMKAKGVNRRAAGFPFVSEGGDDEATVIARSPFDDDQVVSSAAASEPAKVAPEKAPAAAIRQSTPEIKPAASPLAAARASSPELKSEPQAAKPVAARRAEKRPGADLFGSVASAGSEEDSSLDFPARDEPAQKMTGARNESSVLFSLDALTKPDPKAGQKKAQEKEKEKEASAVLFGESSPNSLMNVGGGGIGNFGAMAAPDFTKPVVAAPEPTRPSDPVEVPNNAAPAKKKGGALIVVAIIGVAAAAAAAFVLTKKPPEKPSETATAEKPVATQAAAVPAPTATDTGASAANTASAAPTETAAPAAASAATSAKPATSAAAAMPAAATAAAKPGEKPAAAAAAADAKKPEAATPPAAPAGGDFDKSAAIAALGAAAANAASCKKPDGPTGTGKASVTFAPSGRATNSTVTGAFAGTDVGGCVARIFRGAKVPPFAGDPVTVSKSFTIE